MIAKPTFRYYFELFFEQMMAHPIHVPLLTPRSLASVEKEAFEAATRMATAEHGMFREQAELEQTIVQLRADVVSGQRALEDYERIFDEGYERMADALWSSDDTTRPDLASEDDHAALWVQLHQAQHRAFMDGARILADATAAHAAELKEVRAEASGQRDRQAEYLRRSASERRDFQDQLECLLWSTLEPGVGGRPATDDAFEAREQAIVAEVGRLMGWTGELAEQLEAERRRHAGELAVAHREAKRLLDMARRSKSEHALVPHNDLTDEELAQAVSCACPGGESSACAYVHSVAERLRKRSKEAAALRAEVHDHEDRQAAQPGAADHDIAADEKLAEQTASGVWHMEQTTLAAVP